MNTRWDKVHQVLPDVKEGKMVRIVYASKVLLDDIESLSSSCGCTTPKVVGNSIEVFYTSDNIPVHLKPRGYFLSTQYVIVKYKDGTQDHLSFEVKVIK